MRVEVETAQSDSLTSRINKHEVSSYGFSLASRP